MLSPHERQKLWFAFTWFAVAIIALLLGILIVNGQTSSAHYRHDGPALLADAHYSPGQVSISDKSKLCPRADTQARRNVPESEKLAVCLEYGISARDCTGRKYEIDHIVSLELGGSNDVTNLFPQPYLPKPGAHEKDQVENWLHAQVCSGGMTLHAAQTVIARDWYRLYQKMQQAQGVANRK